MAGRTSRRQFLASTGLAATAAGLAKGSQAEMRQPETSPRPSDAFSPIKSETIEAAERLAGVEYTPPERELLAKSIGRQVQRFKRRQDAPLPSNDLAPALVFDPRLPGMKLDLEQRPVARSAAAAVLPESDDDIVYSPVTHLSRWVESGKLTSRRLTDIYVERLRRLDPKLKFAVTITEELARRQADRADAEVKSGKYRGPLHGIPYGLKDLFDTVDIATTWGAEPYSDRVPKRDATVVRKLAEAGAVLVAKTTLGALAMGDVWHGGRTNNPWNPERGSSGSSAGSAAAVAAGCVGFAIGTETLGSIISPSRTCGSTGLRPTFGRVSRAGAMALCWSLDKVGPMARCSEDCALILAAINGRDDDDPSSLAMPFNFDAAKPIRGLRIGYLKGILDRRGVSPSHQASFDALRGLGCELVEFELPEWPYDSLMNILECEAAAAFEELTRSGRDDLLKAQGEGSWPNSFRKAWLVPAVEMIQSHRFRRQCMRMMMEKFQSAPGLDAIIDPANNGGTLCLITNNTGHPSLTIRIGFNESGLPVGTTLIGRLFDEGTIVRLGMELEGALGVWERRPEV
jgi:Asp-tRNA(Asn)/Glu-tRNA(Gln) amidotransferase A subunit family amidase